MLASHHRQYLHRRLKRRHHNIKRNVRKASTAMGNPTPNAAIMPSLK
jgi:hypothetical protein